MSDEQKRPHAQVMAIAEALMGELQPACERIAIAGSLRRACETVGDIEMVAIPKLYEVQVDLFGETEQISMLDEQLTEWMDSGFIEHAEHKRWGDKLKAFVYLADDGGWYKVDLFIQPDPATWGVNMMIRTGSWQFSRWMVTPQRQGGAMPNRYKVAEARVWHDGMVLPTPEEADVFALWKMGAVPPQERSR